MQPPQHISVLVINHHPTFLQMITRFLEQERLCRIMLVGAVFRPDDALALAEARQPHIIVLGLNGNASTALALIAPLRRLLPEVGIIAVAQLGVVEYQQAALAAGANCLLTTDILHRALVPTITSLADTRSTRP
jgi:DNA-binding NarL/FixJ family response regulator